MHTDSYYDSTTPSKVSQIDAELACKNSLDFLAAAAIPEVYEAEFPPLFLGLWSMLTAALEKVRDFSKFAVGLPRGHAKTTVLKLLVLWAILFSNRKFILIVCNTATLAENVIADVMDMLHSRNIQEIFGAINDKNDMEVNRQELKKFRYRGRDIIIGGIGVEGSVRGLNIKNARPDIIIGDDMQNKEQAGSEAVSKKLISWMAGTLMKAKSSKGCTYIYVGNMYRDIKIGGAHSNLYTCILRNLQKDPGWTSWIVGGILADGHALWEEVQPLEQLLADLQGDINMGCPEVFFSEVMNDPNCGSGIHFDISKMPMYDIDPLVDIEVGRFIMIDPSLGKKRSDAQIVAEFSVYDSIPVCTHIHIRMESAPDLVKFVLNLSQQNQIPLICAESVAYQATLLQWFAFFAEQEHISGKHFLPVSPKGRKKNSRILNMMKQMMAGNLKVAPTCLAQVLAQIQSFDPISENNSDDILDTLAYADDVMVQYPTEMVLTDIYSTDEDWSLGVVEDSSCF